MFTHPIIIHINFCKKCLSCKLFCKSLKCKGSNSQSMVSLKFLTRQCTHATSTIKCGHKSNITHIQYIHKARNSFICSCLKSRIALTVCSNCAHTMYQQRNIEGLVQQPWRDLFYPPDADLGNGSGVSPQAKLPLKRKIIWRRERWVEVIKKASSLWRS